MFRPTVISTVIKVHPRHLGSNVPDHIKWRLRQGFDGKCSAHGFIKAGSVELLSIGSMQVELQTLSGFVNTTVSFRANVFNPQDGSIVDATIKVTNAFGAMAIVTVDGAVIMQVILPKEIATVPVDQLTVGQEVKVEIVKRKMMPNDEVLYAIGRIATPDIINRISSVGLVGGNEEDRGDEVLIDVDMGGELGLDVDAAPSDEDDADDVEDAEDAEDVDDAEENEPDIDEIDDIDEDVQSDAVTSDADPEGDLSDE